MFKITHTNKAVFGDEKFNTDYRNTPHDEKRFAYLKAKCVHKFRCLDAAVWR